MPRDENESPKSSNFKEDDTTLLVCLVCYFMLVCGVLCVSRFSQPPNSLFKKDDVDSVQTLFWQRMEKHVEYATIQYFQVAQNQAKTQNHRQTQNHRRLRNQTLKTRKRKRTPQPQDFRILKKVLCHHPRSRKAQKHHQQENRRSLRAGAAKGKDAISPRKGSVIAETKAVRT